jgi:hypothetical protein
MNGPLAGAPRRVYTLFLGSHAWSAPIGNGEHCAPSFTSQKISARPPAQMARAVAFDRDVSPIRLAPWSPFNKLMLIVESTASLIRALDRGSFAFEPRDKSPVLNAVPSLNWRQFRDDIERLCCCSYWLSGWLFAELVKRWS